MLYNSLMIFYFLKKPQRLLRLYGLFYLLRNSKSIWRYPGGSLFAYFRSLLKKAPGKELADFYLFGLQDLNTLSQSKPLLLAFSYCQRPAACPLPRFSDICPFDRPGCASCFIGKCMRLCQKAPDITPIIVTTAAAWAKQAAEWPGHFIACACPLSLKMFGDLANAAKLPGIGIALNGPVCGNTKAFRLAEAGVKPRSTQMSDDAQKFILQEIFRRSRKS